MFQLSIKRGTGHYSAKNGREVEYESLAECIALYSAERNPLIKEYYTQAYQIEIPVKDGQPWFYIPDIIAIYHSGQYEVIEVKKRAAALLDKSNSLRRRIAESYCKEKGWKYTLFIEELINPVFVRNLKFLFGYRHRKAERQKWAQHIIALLMDAGALSIIEIAKQYSSLEVIPAVYNMIWSCDLQTDLKLRLDSKSIVCLPKQEV